MKPHAKHLSLENQNHEQFGRAISRCQGWTPNCVRTGECEYDGDCFHDEISYRIDAIKKIRALFSESSPLVILALRQAIKTIEAEIEIERRPKG